MANIEVRNIDAMITVMFFLRDEVSLIGVTKVNYGLAYELLFGLPSVPLEFEV